ncbi:transaldolase [Solicola sp. PLA-1-18]|uniref:transaldolase n=1 Tax=Solicola sp. PLA-1-18 TaxID=3380532 RepID=UPI003B785B94
MNDRLRALSNQGVSIWLDDLSRERIASGNLDDLVQRHEVVGVTTNPTIFASALSNGERYNEQVAQLAAAGADVDTAIFEITTTDVRDAAHVLRPVFDRTDGADGRVSIEVEPGMARKTDETIAEAQRLWDKVGEQNVLIKIPATEEGLPAIAATIARGISVNVTLIFSLDRYKGVMDAYLYGLEQADAEGRDLSKIHSVASFFVSRVDGEIDKRLDALGTDEATALKGRAAVANARLAYELYEKTFASERFAALEAKGANRQRPLWASTGVKNPDYKDTMYVSDLVVANTVNTMPEKTLEAVADHGEVTGDTVTGTYDEARATLDAIEHLGIKYDDVVAVLEDEGLDKFDVSWGELQETVKAELEKAK